MTWQDREMICTWPNGESRKVMVTAIGNNGFSPVPDGKARILWNQPVSSESKAVMGSDDIVPSEWLSEV